MEDVKDERGNYRVALLEETEPITAMIHSRTSPNCGKTIRKRRLGSESESENLEIGAGEYNELAPSRRTDDEQC